jgi:hypothetical protein
VKAEAKPKQFNFFFEELEPEVFNGVQGIYIVCPHTLLISECIQHANENSFDTRVICKVTMSLGVLSPSIPSFSGM